jgi:DNA-binding protein H-NS
MSPNSDDLDLNQFKELPLEKLQDMMTRVQGLVDKRLETRKKEALRKIKDIVKDQELSFDEVVNVIRTSAKRGKAPPIFRNPEKPRQTWSGKGEAPDWYKNNTDPDSLRIPD